MGRNVESERKEAPKATEIDFFRSCRNFKLERVRNRTIMEMMCEEQTVVEEIERRELVWFGHTKKMENRWSIKSFGMDSIRTKQEGKI